MHRLGLLMLLFIQMWIICLFPLKANNDFFVCLALLMMPMAGLVINFTFGLGWIPIIFPRLVS